MKNNVYHFLTNIKYETAALALIDPDIKNDDKLIDIVDKVNFANFDAILVGGSILSDDKYLNRIKKIKQLTSKPLILFPGSSSQINNDVDAVLYLSLISGRNPKYLIEEHVNSALSIYNSNIETIPVGYILIDGSTLSDVQIESKTLPISANETEMIVSHALASQYLGHKFIFLEAGSGAAKHIEGCLVENIKKYLDIPIIVGGGIVNLEIVKNIKKGCPDFMVIGNFLEQDNNKEEIKKMVNLIHE